MVDIDDEVIRIVKEYLPEMSQGAFSDPRLRLVISDGRKFLEEYFPSLITPPEPVKPINTISAKT